MTKKDRLKGVEELILLGKEKGYLTYDQVNDLLPRDVFSPEQIDDVMVLFGENDIEVIDTDAEDVQNKLRVKEHDKPPEKESYDLEDQPGKTDDPVRMYLREMGTIPLLTREGEVEIAKRIEEGYNEVVSAVLQAPVHLLDLKRPQFGKRDTAEVRHDVKTKEILIAPVSRWRQIGPYRQEPPAQILGNGYLGWLQV